MREIGQISEEVSIDLWSPDAGLLAKLDKLLQMDGYAEKVGISYRCRHIGDADELGEGTQIVLLDEAAIATEAASRLGEVKLRLGEVPFVYLCDHLDDVDELRAVKSLAADYLLKPNITASVLHNCIRWTLDNTRLKLDLEQQNQRYQSLFHNAVDGMFFLDPYWNLVHVNDAFGRIFGGDALDLAGMEFAALFHDRRDFERLRESLSSGAKAQMEIECKFIPPKGKGHFLGLLKIGVLREFDFAERPDRKVVKGYQGALSNIAYRERMRNIRQRADRVDMTYRLARTLAHEIRNPLTNIRLALEHIRDVGELGTKGSSTLDVIERSSTRINTLIDRLLTASERGAICARSCELNAIVREVIEESRDRATLTGVRLLTDFEAEEFPYSCDADKIKLALSNLVGNAIESIEHKSGRVTVGTYLDEGYACLYVEDNGNGMSEEVKQSLFDPFFTAKADGLGLGLTATQTIVSEHGGEIEVESAEGFGSTFTITLPAQ